MVAVGSEGNIGRLSGHVDEALKDEALLRASSFERPTLLKTIARTAMGLDPTVDITMLSPVIQDDLLTVMGSIRDALNDRDKGQINE